MNKELVDQKDQKTIEEEDDKESENKNKNENEEESDFDLIEDLVVDAPPEYICPITMSIMRDPVIMPDGHTYERQAIELALQRNPISPMTREPMDMSQAQDNNPLKSMIDKYIQKHSKEIEKAPEVTDQAVMFRSSKKIDIPCIKIKKIQLDSFSAQYTPDSMLITIKPQEIHGRLPISLIAIIDISSSMIIDATLEGTNTEENSISRIQLVQYSLKTVISTLSDSDKISIITFNGKAKKIASGVSLTQEGKEKIFKIIDDIDPNGSTNLWDGLNKGIDEAINQQNKRTNTSLLVFTDGQPNVHPPNGLIPTLKKKLSKHKSLFSISTFGYGYNIDADLIKEISEIGNGIYGYIPDASMVGTIFINYISNLASIISPLVSLKVKLNDKKSKKFHVVLYNGAPTHVMISLNEDDNPEEAQIEMNLTLTNEKVPIQKISPLDENEEEEVIIYRDQKYRKSLIDLISETNDVPLDEMRNKAIELFEKLRKEKKENRSQFMKNLMIDLYNDDEQHGQIERAYKEDDFNKWGKNYLFSLLRFHIFEQCGNFRDMSLQLYGNKCFLKFRKVGNKLFMNLPIPEKKSKYDLDKEFNIENYKFSSDEEDDDDDEEEEEEENEEEVKDEDENEGEKVKKVEKRKVNKRKVRKEIEEDENEEKEKEEVKERNDDDEEDEVKDKKERNDDEDDEDDEVKDKKERNDDDEEDEVKDKKERNDDDDDEVKDKKERNDDDDEKKEEEEEKDKIEKISDNDQNDRSKIRRLKKSSMRKYLCKKLIKK